eukprot:scaffold65259_cov57-Phaeocystis_antarctica.AAC.2
MQSATLSLTEAEKARATLAQAKAARFIDAAFGVPACPEASPPPLSPPSSPPLSPPPVIPPPLLSLPSLPPSVSPSPTAILNVVVQLFDSFGDGWNGLQLVVSGAAVERSFSLPTGLSSTQASLSLPLGCYELRMYQDGEPLTSTATDDAVEASWRLLGCPSRVYLASEAARACVTETSEELKCAYIEPPTLPPPSPPSP